MRRSYKCNFQVFKQKKITSLWISEKYFLLLHLELTKKIYKQCLQL